MRSHQPDNKETGYSNVLVKYCPRLPHDEEDDANNVDNDDIDDDAKLLTV